MKVWAICVWISTKTKRAGAINNEINGRCESWWLLLDVIRSSTESLSIDYGGRTKEGWQTGHLEPARADASPSRSTAKGDEKVFTHKGKAQKTIPWCAVWNGLSKPTGDVGQQGNDNLWGKGSQFGLGIQRLFSVSYSLWMKCLCG